MLSRNAVLVLSAVLVASPLLTADPTPGAPDVRLAVLPCTNIEAAFTRFQPMLAYVRRETGLRVSLALMAESSEFETAVRHGTVDLVLQDPHTFQRLAAFFDTSAMLQTLGPDGSLLQSGVVITRRDTGITGLTQLAGKRVMFGPRTSSAKWFAARQLFEARGILVDRDLVRTHGGCCEDIAFAVIVGSVDAGVICDHFLGQHQARQGELGIDPRLLKVIGQTPPIPTRVLSSRKGAPTAAVNAVFQCLRKLDARTKEHELILRSAEIGGFVDVSVEEYLRRLTPGMPTAAGGPPRE